MQSRRAWIGLATLFAILTWESLCGNSLAHAQGASGGRYQSRSGPTITPYLDYFRRDNGQLTPYHNFVQPKFQLRENQQQVDSFMRQEMTRGATLQREVNQLQQMRQSTARPTGSGATYMNYSHFYPQGAAPGIPGGGRAGGGGGMGAGQGGGYGRN
ncbi:MAG: hypothetical protein U1A77_08265 [Pirellulales bacterium]